MRGRPSDQIITWPPSLSAADKHTKTKKRLKGLETKGAGALLLDHYTFRVLSMEK